MLNADLLTFLEHAISRALHDAESNETKGFWCDGILLSEGNGHYSQKSVNNNKQVTLKAFVGKDGQTPYQLTLLFGNQALSRYARGLSLERCVPDRSTEDWFEIDVQNKK